MERLNAAPGTLECSTFGTEEKVMVFEPSMEEFKDFEKYVKYMEEQGAHKAGIAKVIPPPEWCARKSGYSGLENFKITSPVEQLLVGSNGAYTLCNVEKKALTLGNYMNVAQTRKFEPPAAASFDDLERYYWKNLHCFHPLYGADIPGSITDESQPYWNIATLPSILKCINDDHGIQIAGVNTPYLYFGMWKTTFPWHTEDADLYSINYLHFGAPKFWYVVPPEHGIRLERVAQGYFQSSYKQCHAFLRHKTTVLSPTLLHNYSIPYNKVLQFPGQFIITFPYGYHSGFNTGFNCAESTNFAIPRWIDYGKYCTQCQCMPDAVKIDMDGFVRRYQPDRYEAWIAGTEKGAHPEGAAAGQTHARFSLLAPPPLLEGEILKSSKPQRSRRQPRAKINSSSKKRRTDTTCRDGTVSDDISHSKSDSPYDKSHPSSSSNGHLISASSTPISSSSSTSACSNDTDAVSNNNKNNSSSAEQNLHGAEFQCENTKIVTALKPPISEAGERSVSTERCSCGRCQQFFPEKDSNLRGEIEKLDIVEAATPLWIWQNFSFDAERAFNHFMSLRAPFCAICQHFLFDSPVVNGPLPPRTVPMIPELAFALRTVHRSRHITALPTESRFLYCSKCLLVVHAFCYGAEEDALINTKDSWLCYRCSFGTLDAHCSLCVLRGGALKPTSSGNWAHVICALLAENCLFMSDLTRCPIIEPKNDVDDKIGSKSVRCPLCQRSDGSMVRCTVGLCPVRYHVTCGSLFGVIFLIDSWPTPTSVVCLLRHSNRRKTILNWANSPCPEIGDRVLFISTQPSLSTLDNTNKLPIVNCSSPGERLIPGTVTVRNDIVRLQVTFSESATACDDFDPADVVDPPASKAMALPRTWLTVRWPSDSGGFSVHKAFCRSTTRQYNYTVQLDNHSIVENISPGQLVPFFISHYDPFYFDKQINDNNI